jgi:hypothetical protein
LTTSLPASAPVQVYDSVERDLSSSCIYPAFVRKRVRTRDSAVARVVADGASAASIPPLLHFAGLKSIYGASQEASYVVHASVGEGTVGSYAAVLHLTPVGVPLDVLPPTLEQLPQVAADVLRGLSELHALNFVHRDLRWSNIFWGPGERGGKKWCFVGDLECGGFVSAGVTLAAVDKRPFELPPEVQAGAGWTAAADIFMCGRMLAAGFGRAQVHGALTPPWLGRMLEPDAARRPTAAAMVVALEALEQEVATVSALQALSLDDVSARHASPAIEVVTPPAAGGPATEAFAPIAAAKRMLTRGASRALRQGVREDDTEHKAMGKQ